MKKMICALFLIGVLIACLTAHAAQLSEAIMIYEDYDGNRAEWTVSDEAELEELKDILMRAKGNKATLENCTMNCTLLCKLEGGDIVDFAVATDGCPYITNMDNEQTYRLSDADQARLWEIFDQIQAAMGYDASVFMEW